MEELNGGLICLEAATGAIKAMVGGVDFNVSQFNRALQAHRQPGSIIKPLIYTAAVKNNISLTSVEKDEPFSLKIGNSIWEPRNAHRTFDGYMTLAKALATSNNIISVKTLLKVGIEEVAQLIERTRLVEKVVRYPSLALGCVDASVKNVAGMFNIFANNGCKILATVIELQGNIFLCSGIIKSSYKFTRHTTNTQILSF